MISIIIPTYNEAKNIQKIIPLINKYVKKYHEIIIVDDNSPDRTWKIAEEMPRKYKVKVIRRVNEKGLATAVIRGFKEAKGEIVGVIDADLSHPPWQISTLETADLAVVSEKILSSCRAASRPEPDRCPCPPPHPARLSSGRR